MASSDVTFLRNAARTQAKLYREHLKKMARLRNDDAMELDVKRQKMHAQLAATREQLAQLERDVKAKAAAVRSRVVAKTAPTDIARSDVRYMLSKKMGLSEIGRYAIEQKRPEVLAALREMIPMLAAAHDLPNQGKGDITRATREAMATLEQFEQQVATPEEQALYTERREVEAGIGHLERNFQSIDGDLQVQERGAHPILQQLNSWPGLPGDGQYTGPISLAAEGVA